MVKDKFPEEKQREFPEEFSEEIARKEARKIKARQNRGREFWFWLGMFGLVGWSVAIPSLLGVAIGIWLDKIYPINFSWTLTFLIVGVLLGCVNAWYWIKRESRGE